MSNVYLYRLHAPRPDFSTTMSEDEAQTMGRHAGFWSGLMAEGKALVFAPVPDPAGDWGMAIAVAPDLETVQGFGAADPAVASGMMDFSVTELAYAITPDRLAAAGNAPS